MQILAASFTTKHDYMTITDGNPDNNNNSLNDTDNNCCTTWSSEMSASQAKIELFYISFPTTFIY